MGVEGVQVKLVPKPTGQTVTWSYTGSGSGDDKYGGRGSKEKGRIERVESKSPVRYHPETFGHLTDGIQETDNSVTTTVTSLSSFVRVDVHLVQENPPDTGISPPVGESSGNLW